MEQGSAIRALHQRRFYFDNMQTWFVGHSVRYVTCPLPAGANESSRAIPDCMSGISLFLSF